MSPTNQTQDRLAVINNRQPNRLQILECAVAVPSQVHVTRLLGEPLCDFYLFLTPLLNAARKRSHLFYIFVGFLYTDMV